MLYNILLASPEECIILRFEFIVVLFILDYNREGLHPATPSDLFRLVRCVNSHNFDSPTLLACT